MEQCQCGQHDEEIVGVKIESRPSLFHKRTTCLITKHCGKPMKRVKETLVFKCKKCLRERTEVVKTLACANSECNWRINTNLTCGH